MDVRRGTNAAGEVNGRPYSGHAFDQMQGRGITPSVVDDAIENGQVLGRSAGDRVIHYSQPSNVSVVVAPDGRVITVGFGRFRPKP